MQIISRQILELLGKPGLIEELSFEQILAARKAKFVDLLAAYGLAYDVINLESDPAVALLEEAAYEEVILRARGNDIVRGRYLDFARGTEVDRLAGFYGVVRLPGESDDRLKDRTILAINGRSTGGTAPRYRSVAMTSSIRVADAVVYTEGTDPTVKVAVFATDNNGVADAALLSTVRAALNADDVRMVNDIIEVRSAVVQVVNVVADITLQPSTSIDLLTTLSSTLPATWVNESGLGRDLVRDWLVAKLMVSGVHKVSVTAPAADVVVQPFQAVRIGTVTLNLVGRNF